MRRVVILRLIVIILGRERELCVRVPAFAIGLWFGVMAFAQQESLGALD